jgi:hypothetical protein
MEVGFGLSLASRPALHHTLKTRKNEKQYSITRTRRNGARAVAAGGPGLNSGSEGTSMLTTLEVGRMSDRQCWTRLERDAHRLRSLGLQGRLPREAMPLTLEVVLLAQELQMRGQQLSLMPQGSES